ncbi:hypothetical protein AYK24_08665 [Thermoplasmatales archaeon SG8-52-4]|nr:MAG: hypothetical protein AYK24_08665 [Thermoplasmatales archaeon SG8-52-4]
MTLVPTINARIEKINKQIDETQSITNSEFPPYKLLIITPQKFERYLKPLKVHKEKYGITTYIATLDEIYEKMYWNGRDKAEKIKYYIKESIENWGTQYVLLIGGKVRQFNRWHLPVRYINVGNSWERHILSDLYFADIYDSKGDFSSWDSDEDGIYGEWFYGEQPEDKNIDLIPDVAVGRLPCRNRFEVILMVKKIISYEKTAYNKPWFYDMVAIAGDTYPEYQNPDWAGNEGEIYADMAIENMTGFNPIKLYTSNETLKSWKDMKSAINNGCGFLYFVGHGSATSWSTHFPNSKNWTEGFTVSHFPHLKNINKLPICVVSGCHNCQFDVSIFNLFNETRKNHGEAGYECWGWRMTRKIGGGSIATIGCSALGFTKEDKVSFKGGINELEVEFFKAYGQDNIDIIGDTWKEAINWYVSSYPIDWGIELTNDSWVDIQVPSTWTLLGDPSLKIGGYPSAMV